jgi:hypothetical protein
MSETATGYMLFYLPVKETDVVSALATRLKESAKNLTAK